MSETLRLVWKHRVGKVEERFENGPSVKNAEGKWEATRRSLGWWVTLQPGHVAYRVGAEPPELEEGQEVVLALEGERRVVAET